MLVAAGHPNLIIYNSPTEMLDANFVAAGHPNLIIYNRYRVITLFYKGKHGI